MSEHKTPPTYQLDHICLAVRALGTARELLQRMLGYEPLTSPVENTRQKVTVQFMRKAGSIDIKLIEPSSPDSPLVDFVHSRGGGLHHLAFRTEFVEVAVEDVKGKGAKVLAPPAPGEAFDDALIAFCFLGAGLNVEFIETDRRRGEIGEPRVGE